MGILDDMMGAIGGKGHEGALMAAATRLLGKESGGLGGLIQKFEQAGLGDTIKGWISTGPNPGINSEQLQAALGSDLVQKIAGQAGVDPNNLLASLSKHLPGMIDKLTPDGVAPDANALQGMLGGILGQMFEKK